LPPVVALLAIIFSGDVRRLHRRLSANELFDNLSARELESDDTRLTASCISSPRARPMTAFFFARTQRPRTASLVFADVPVKLLPHSEARDDPGA